MVLNRGGAQRQGASTNFQGAGALARTATWKV